MDTPHTQVIFFWRKARLKVVWCGVCKGGVGHLSLWEMVCGWNGIGMLFARIELLEYQRPWGVSGGKPQGWENEITRKKERGEKKEKK